MSTYEIQNNRSQLRINKKKDTFDSYSRTGCSEDDTDGVLMVSTHENVIASNNLHLEGVVVG